MTFPVISEGVFGAQEKPKTRILILGPYRSAYSRSLLHGLRECARLAGYGSASLVEDVPFREARENETPGEYYLQKSYHVISNWAQVALFIFPRITRRGMDYSGVILEFIHMLEHASWLLNTSSVFYEKKDFDRSSLTLAGKVKLSHVSQRFFSTQSNLCNRVLREMTSHQLSLYP